MPGSAVDFNLGENVTESSDYNEVAPFANNTNLTEIEYRIKSESSDGNLSESSVDVIAKIIYEFAYSTSTTNITNNLVSISSSSSWQTKEKSSSSLSNTTLANIKVGWMSDSLTNTNYNNVNSGDSDVLNKYTLWNNGNVLRKRINGIVWQVRRIKSDTRQSTFSFLVETIDGVTFPNMYRGGIISSTSKETTTDKQVFFGINDSISTNKTSDKQIKISISVN